MEKLPQQKGKKFAEKINKQRLALLKKSTPIMMVKSQRQKKKLIEKK